MVIGYVLDDTLDKTDGVQQSMIAIAEQMRGLGHEVHYIVPYTRRTDLQNVHSVAKFISFKFNGNSIRTPISSSKRKIKQLFVRYKFDVIHVQMPYSPIMASRVIMAAPKTTTVVGTFHILPYSFMANLGTKLIGLFMWRSLRRFNKVYAVSEPALKFMQKSFKLQGSALPNPVKYDFYHNFAQGLRLEKESKIKIVFVGRFDERKGVKQLVNAYSKLPERDKIELVMCGNGPLRSGIKSAAESQKLNILLPGFVSEEEKAKYLASANIAVFPSTAGESFGIVLLEAMAAGAEITIGGNNPGYSSVLEPWPETLFNPNSISEFTQKLDVLINSETLRNSIGAKQHEAVKQYDVDAVVRRLLEESYTVSL